jgi:hypothetical protein
MLGKSKAQRRFSAGWRAFWGLNAISTLPDGSMKLAEIATLDSRLEVDDAAVALLILDEIKDIVDKKRAVNRTLEGKATSVVGFATAVLGFVAQYRSGALLAIDPNGIPVVIAVFVLELAAIACGLYALQPQAAAFPDPLLYNYPSAVENPKNRARIAMALAQSWAEYERDLDVGIVRRSKRFDVAMWAFALGIILTILLVFINVTASASINRSAATHTSAPNSQHTSTLLPKRSASP